MENTTPFPAPVAASPRAEEQPEIQPMPLRLSLLLFAVPAALTALSFHAFRPWLEGQVYSPLTSFLASLTVPAALLLAAALVAYHRVEGRPLEWPAFSRRMRFPQFRPVDALLGLGLFLALAAGYGLFSSFGNALIRAGLIHVPAGLPAIVDPLAELTPATLDRMAGGRGSGTFSCSSG